MTELSKTERTNKIIFGWQAFLEGNINNAIKILQSVALNNGQEEPYKGKQGDLKPTAEIAEFFRTYNHPKLSGVSQETRNQFTMALAQSWLFSKFNIFNNDRLIETLPLSTLLGMSYSFDIDVESMNIAVYGTKETGTEWAIFDYALPFPYKNHHDNWPELTKLLKVSIPARRVFIRIVQYVQIKSGLSEYERLKSEEMPELKPAISELVNVGLVDADLSFNDLLMTQSIVELKKFALDHGISAYGIKQKICQTICREIDIRKINEFLQRKNIDNSKYLRPLISNLPSLKKYIWAEIYRMKVYVRWIEDIECLKKKVPIRQTHTSNVNVDPQTNHMAPNAYEANIFSREGIGFKQKNPLAAKLIDKIWDKKCDEIVRNLTVDHGWYSPRYIGHRILEQLPEETRNAFEQQFWDKTGSHPYWGIVYYSIDRIHELNINKREPRELVCAGCKKKFNEWSISEQIANRVGNRIHFCSSCYNIVCWPLPSSKKHISKNKQELTKKLSELVKILEFIPTKSFMQKPILDKYSDIKQIKIVRILLNMQDFTVYEETFGSWLQALIASGVLDKGVQTGGRGYRCVANDGHICLSLAEKVIDDWLSVGSIPHSKEPKYPYDYYLNSSGQLRADWLVGNTFIEYAGMMIDPEYAQKMRGKEELAKKFNLDLIIIEPQDLFSLEGKLGRLQASKK